MLRPFVCEIPGCSTDRALVVARIYVWLAVRPMTSRRKQLAPALMTKSMLTLKPVPDGSAQSARRVDFVRHFASDRRRLRQIVDRLLDGFRDRLPMRVT